MNGTYEERAQKNFAQELSSVSALNTITVMTQEEYQEEYAEDLEEWPDVEERIRECKSAIAPYAITEYRTLEVECQVGGPSAGYVLFFINMGGGDWEVTKGYYRYQEWLQKELHFWLELPALEAVVKAYSLQITD